MTAPKRRWFQWSLRTMFVMVTVFACFLGYELNWIRQRHDFYARHSGFTVETFQPSGTAPGLLWIFGETGWPSIRLQVEAIGPESLTDADRQLLQRAKRLFPEAAKYNIYLLGKGPPGFDWATIIYPEDDK